MAVTVKAKQRDRRRRSMVLAWVVLILFLMVAFVGVATDVGYLMFVAHQLQNAADAASLAAAQKVHLDVDQTRQADIDCALANEAAGAPVQCDANAANAPDGDIVIGRFNRDTGEFTPTLFAPKSVKVVARRTDTSLAAPVRLLFGSLFGIDTANVYRSAIATSEGGTGAGLIALDPDDSCSLTIQGSVFVDVNSGAMQVKSGDDDALCVIGSVADTNASEINVTGDERITGNNDNFDDILNTGQPPIPDPLADLPEPTWDPADDLGEVRVTDSGANITLRPGFYSGGIFANGGTITLDPGIYILDGAGLSISGNTTFIAEGVMFFITGTGFVDLRGTGIIRITPPDPDLYSYPGVDTYEGISIFQARDNTNESTIIGTSLMELVGTLYFPAARLNLGGTGEGFGNQLIANTINIFGTGEITINYDGRNPAPGGDIFLVK